MSEEVQAGVAREPHRTTRLQWHRVSGDPNCSEVAKVILQKGECLYVMQQQGSSAYLVDLSKLITEEGGGGKVLERVAQDRDFQERVRQATVQGASVDVDVVEDRLQIGQEV